MRYVLDSNVALKWFLPEAHSEIARAVLERWRLGQVDLVAPDILLAEFGHALRKHVAGRTVSGHEARTAWQTLRALPLDLVPTPDLVDEAFRLSVEHMGSFYDALYIALAQREDLTVLTADGRMVSAFASLNRTLPLTSAAF